LEVKKKKPKNEAHRNPCPPGVVGMGYFGARNGVLSEPAQRKLERQRTEAAAITDFNRPGNRRLL
jgi:hypothetical protein